MHPAGGPWYPSAPLPPALRSSPPLLLSSSPPWVFEDKYIAALDAFTRGKTVSQCSRIWGVLLLNVLLATHFFDQVSHLLFPFPSQSFPPPPGFPSPLLAPAARFGQGPSRKRSPNPHLSPLLQPDAPGVALASGSNGAFCRASAQRECSADPRRDGAQEAARRASRHTPHRPCRHVFAPARGRRQGAG
jgi:hypothetical protein